MKKILATLCAISLLVSGTTTGSAFATANQSQTGLIESTYKLNVTSNALAKNEMIDIAPMYDLPSNYFFEFKYDKKLPLILPYEVYHGMNVYEDKACTKEISSMLVESDDKKSFILKPTSYGNYRRKDIDSAGENHYNVTDEKRLWGSKKAYYLKMDYDYINGTFEKLDKPIRMMFTLESKVDSPSPRFELQNNGSMHVVWAPVKGAVKYKVYSGVSIEMELHSEVTQPFYSFTQERYFDKEKLMNDEYDHLANIGIVAVDKDGNHSRIAYLLDVDLLEGTLVNEVASYHKSFGRYDIKDIKYLPEKVDVLMNEKIPNTYDKISKSYGVVWDFDSPPATDKYGNFIYNGYVVGTSLVVTYMSNEKISTKEIAGFKSTRKQQGPNAIRTDIERQVEIPSAPTIDDVEKIDEAKGIKSKDEDLRSHIAESNTTEKQSQSLDEKILLGWLNFENRINLSSYPEAADGHYLRDVITALLYQNPLVQDVEDIQLDYVTGELVTTYKVSQSEGLAKQKLILDKVNTITSSIISPNDSDQVKYKKLHDWLVQNAEYHNAPLDAYLNGESMESISSKYETSFQPAGILLNGTGVCQSYAGVYKLLSDSAGLETIMVSGDSSGVPHAWNKIHINGEWVNLDATNNDNDLIPYPVYGTSDAYTSYILDRTHLLDSELESHESNTITYDYYNEQERLAESALELTTILNTVSSKKVTTFVKLNPTLTENDITQAIRNSDLSQDTSWKGLKRAGNFLYIEY